MALAFTGKFVLLVSCSFKFSLSSSCTILVTVLVLLVGRGTSTLACSIASLRPGRTPVRAQFKFKFKLNLKIQDDLSESVPSLAVAVLA